MKSLLFFTDTFPLGGLTEPSFIFPEIEIINKLFDKITIFPENKTSKGEKVILPEKFHINLALCNQKKSGNSIKLLSLLFNPFVLKLLFKEKKRIKNRYQFFSFLRYINKAFIYKAYLKELFLNEKFDYQNTVFYSFWFTEITFALAMLCNKFQLTIYCRAHGYDIYDERVIFRSHAIRNYTLNKIKHVYTCSRQSQDYMRKQYPEYIKKIHFSYLGCTKIYHSFNPKLKNVEDNKKMIFFTCARLHPVKRLPMTFHILSAVAQYFKDIHIYWDIIGEGEERTILQELIVQNRVPNFTVNLLGSKSNEEVQKIYSLKHIDWGILLSESEGLGLSICEQLAYKIPVIATNVGGIPEVIDDSCGILLSANPTAEELINKLVKFICNSGCYNTICNNAYDKWSQFFNSDKNRSKFIEKLCFSNC